MAQKDNLWSIHASHAQNSFSNIINLQRDSSFFMCGFWSRGNTKLSKETLRQMGSYQVATSATGFTAWETKKSLPVTDTNSMKICGYIRIHKGKSRKKLHWSPFQGTIKPDQVWWLVTPWEKIDHVSFVSERNAQSYQYSYDVEGGIHFADKWQLMTTKIVINLEHHSAAVKIFIQIDLYLIMNRDRVSPSALGSQKSYWIHQASGWLGTKP